MRYARAIHQLAKKAKVAVLGTGVNPGFVMDALPITLTGVCERVDAIRIDRIQDARIRRLPFQQKIGAGLTREQFQRKVDDGSVRHVGLAESVSMIADALGWKLDRITDEIQPRIATQTVASEYLAVDPGYVCGIIQDGIGYRNGLPVITLHMEAYLGAPESYDAVEISGSPALKMKIAGGVHGDIATASIVVNSLPKILEVAPGLHTMRDMPIPSFFGGALSRRLSVRAVSDACRSPQRRRFKKRPFARDAEEARGLLDAAVRAFERAADQRLLERVDGGGQRLIEPEANLGSAVVALAAIVRREARISGESSAGVSVASGSAKRDHALHFVGELPDVAGPRRRGAGTRASRR